jgi:16S rRNA (adenine1518-N6/adenine1519-N6)-dimethyltransferase
MNKYTTVKAKKHLGQHFLNDEQIAKDIADLILLHPEAETVLEIGPGMGVLTKYLYQTVKEKLFVCEIDTESVDYLNKHFPELKNNILEKDFLQLNLAQQFGNKLAIIGNFPYNISTEIVFKIIENRNQIPFMAGMFQKEVAERFAAPPGSKVYGITSVLAQAFYTLQYHFTVPEHVFTPPPKVKSGVITLTRNTFDLNESEYKRFKTVVKTAFNQRRKTLRNALQTVMDKSLMTAPIFDKRAEQLSVNDFLNLSFNEKNL